MNLEHKVKMLDAEWCFHYVQSEELEEDEELIEHYKGKLEKARLWHKDELSVISRKFCSHGK